MRQRGLSSKSNEESGKNVPMCKDDWIDWILQREDFHPKGCEKAIKQVSSSTLTTHWVNITYLKFSLPDVWKMKWFDLEGMFWKCSALKGMFSTYESQRHKYFPDGFNLCYNIKMSESCKQPLHGKPTIKSYVPRYSSLSQSDQKDLLRNFP